MFGFNKGVISQGIKPFEFGNALTFAGSNDYVSFTTQIDLSGVFTYSIWMKMTSYDDYVSTSVFTNNYHFNNQNSTTIRFNLDGSTSSFSFPSVALNVWENYVLTRDSLSRLRLYRNGLESTTGFLTNNKTLKVGSLGNYPTGTLPIAGTLDEIGILSGVQATPTQITELYNGGLGNDFVSVMGSANLHYKLNESSPASTAVDSSGNGNDGTLVNFDTATCWVAH